MHASGCLIPLYYIDFNWRTDVVVYPLAMYILNMNKFSMVDSK